MFSIRIDDVVYIRGQGMVLAGRVARGAVRAGARVVLKTPSTSVVTTLSGIEQNQRAVSCARSGEHVALLVRGVEPNQLVGGLELVATKESAFPTWKVLSLLADEAPRRWWAFWQ